MGKKFAFSFGGGVAEGHRGMGELLGGKGADLAEMTRMGIPVPPGFTISTEACLEFFRGVESLPGGLAGEVDVCIRSLEENCGQKFGDSENPLLVSVRSGARVSMPGMMDTVLNLGLNDATVEGLARRSGNRRFALDCYRRFLQMFGDVVLGIAGEEYEAALEDRKKARGIRADADLDEEDLMALVGEFRTLTEQISRKNFPENPVEQLHQAIAAVFRSWNNQRAIAYREIHHIPADWGTAVTVQVMVFGNQGNQSATGVAFTRDPSTGAKRFYGEYLLNAQGEDVVAGIRTPDPLVQRTPADGSSLEEKMPEVYSRLISTADKLERHYRDMLDLEFTIEQEKLYLLQARPGKRTGQASVRMAVEMAEEGIIGREEAIRRVDPDQLQMLLNPVFSEEEKQRVNREGGLLARGRNAGPGAAAGKVVFSPEQAVAFKKKGEKTILVRSETSPEDIAGMKAAEGILTARGGMTSHAAVVARGMGKSCVVGCSEIRIESDTRQMTVGNRVIREGEEISIDGSTGEVFLGRLLTRESVVHQALMDGKTSGEPNPLVESFTTLMKWVDSTRRLRVRANADTPENAREALAYGAEGIGLARTEHMFFALERIPTVQEMILASTTEERLKALAKLLPMQREDFGRILEAMDGLPVTIRLLDPPLHEFLPRHSKAQEKLAKTLKVSPEVVKAKVESLQEINPMLGHRGCRMGITYPEIYRTQVQAIFEAACALKRQGKDPRPEVMIPLVGIPEEFKRLRRLVVQEAERIMTRESVRLPLIVGTMMEIPRACLVASEIAAEADFFSFGTNDLTQMTFGYSRDDSGGFLRAYQELGVLEDDPFQVLDRSGVGRLVELATREGKKRRSDLKVGICGEHGGDPRSVQFFHSVGLDYVSCSSFRLPIARLAAARAALESGRNQAGRKGRA